MVLEPLNLCAETLDAIRNHSWDLPVGSSRPRSTTSPSWTQCSRSSGAAARTVASLATARHGWSLASSVSRAASFTGSPMTVYSSRLAAPT